MTEAERARLYEDQAFIDAYMYHGRGSRRPWMRLALMLAAGVFFIWGGFWMYDDLAAWEEAGRPERWDNALLVLAYELGGKGLVRGIAVGLGVLTLATGVIGYVRERAVVRMGRGRR